MDKKYNWELFEEENIIRAKITSFVDDLAIVTYVWNGEPVNLKYPIKLLPENARIDSWVTIVLFTSESMEIERNKILKKLLTEIIN